MNCAYTSESQIFLHKMQRKNPRYKFRKHNCVCGLHILEHNKYMYIPRLIRLFLAVRVNMLYAHAIHSIPLAKKGAVQISPVQKTKLQFLTLKMDARAYGNRNKYRLP